MLMTLNYENQKGKSLELRSFQDVHGDTWWAAADVCEVLDSLGGNLKTFGRVGAQFFNMGCDKQ